MSNLSLVKGNTMTPSDQGGCAACRMVDAGEVYAQIDEAASTVRFLQDPERYNSASVVQRLDSQLQRAMALGDRIRAVNNKVIRHILCTVICAKPLQGVGHRRILHCAMRACSAHQINAEMPLVKYNRELAVTDECNLLQISCDKAYLNKAGGKGKQTTWENQADLALGRDLGGEMSYSFNA